MGYVHYSNEQKREVLEKTKGRSVRSVSKETGIGEQTIRKWKKENNIATEKEKLNNVSLLSTMKETNQRIKELEEENERLRESNRKMRTLLEKMIEAIAKG